MNERAADAEVVARLGRWVAALTAEDARVLLG